MNRIKQNTPPQKGLLRNVARTLALLLSAMAVSILFLHAGGSQTDVWGILMLAVVLTARYTDGYILGMAASAIGFFCVNFVLAHGFMKQPGVPDSHFITFLALLLISAMTSTATSRLKEQRRTLADVGKEAMSANLLRAASHDLRTPLTGIIGASSAYLENGSHMTEEEKTSMVSNIREDAGWLLNMVENLLSITRIRSTGIPVTKTCEPPEEVAAEAVTRLRRRLPDAAIRVTVPDEFLMVPMDATLIEQVMMNLLENAFYHSHSDDPIHLSITVHDGFAWFDIIDHGCGIPADRLNSLFDGDLPPSSSSAHSHKGMGIGLSVCKTIIDAHGGSISASNEKQGARLTFTLPLGEDAYEQTNDCYY